MRGFKRKEVLATALLAAFAIGCGPKSNGMSEEFQQKLEDWSAGKAIEDGIARQKATEPTAAQGDYLEPGEPIWIQSGKSRIIRVARPVRRVSISNPDLAGIVVLGPTALMINAKEIPKDSGGGRTR